MIPRPRYPNTLRCGPGTGECGGRRQYSSNSSLVYCVPRSEWNITPAGGLRRPQAISKGIDDQAGAHVIGDRPADDGSRVQVDHRREVRPTGPGPDVGDVAAPRDVRRRCGEPAGR